MKHEIKAQRGDYLYVLEGGPVKIYGHQVPALAAAKIAGEIELTIEAEKDAELLLVEVALS